MMRIPKKDTSRRAISVSALKTIPKMTALKIPKMATPGMSTRPFVKQEQIEVKQEDLNVKLEFPSAAAAKPKKVRIKRKAEGKIDEPPPKRKFKVPHPLGVNHLVYAPSETAPLCFYDSLKPSLEEGGVTAVRVWRETFELNVRGVDRILKYTDNHLEMKRSSIYMAVLKGVTSHLVKTIHNTDNMRKLNQLLNEAFSYIHIPELQPIAVQVMIKLKDIPEKHIQKLRRMPVLLQTLPESIRHKVWMRYPNDFMQIIKPYLRAYIESYQRQKFPVHFDKNPKSGQERRESFGGLKNIINLIHKSQPLYDEVIRWIRENYELRGKKLAFYALRFDLFKAFQEAGCPMKDDTGWLIDSMDAGITKGKLSRADCDLLNEIKHCSTRQSIQDIMIICHLPMVKSQIPIFIMRQLQLVVSHKKMPRDFNVFKVLLRLFICSQIPMNRIKSRNSFPICETRTITEFLPLACVLYLPWTEGSGNDLKLSNKVEEFIQLTSETQSSCRFFLVMVLLERVHSGSFHRAQQVISLFLTLDANLFLPFKQHFNLLISLVANAAKKTKGFPHALLTDVADFFLHLSSKSSIFGHVLLIQYLAEMADKFAKEDITNRVLHLNQQRITPEILDKTRSDYKRLASVHPAVNDILSQLGILHAL